MTALINAMSWKVAIANKGEFWLSKKGNPDIFSFLLLFDHLLSLALAGWLDQATTVIVKEILRVHIKVDV